MEASSGCGARDGSAERDPSNELEGECGQLVGGWWGFGIWFGGFYLFVPWTDLAGFCLPVLFLDQQLGQVL